MAAAQLSAPGKPDANGTVTYTVSAGFKESSAADVLASIKNGTAPATAITASINNGFGDPAAPAALNYSYDSAKGDFTYSVASSANNTVAQVQSFLTPKAGDTASLKVNIGGTSVDVSLSSDGKITAKDGSALYIDTTGNLTQNSQGLTSTNLATLSGLKSSGKASTITTADGTDIDINAAGNIALTNVRISADSLQSAAKSTGFTVGTGPTGLTVGTDGKVTIGGTTAQSYTSTDGTLTTDNTTKLYLQKDGSVTNGSGKAVYTDAAGKFTTDAETKSATTADPLKALDAAISSIDKFRSSLGAIQNRLDSAVTNLNNTTTNLSEAQSRIQDADYATEVSNMSKAQIIQQAGNSVLAKANQVPQQVLSLLQG